jgi:hypothetical protein
MREHIINADSAQKVTLTRRAVGGPEQWSTARFISRNMNSSLVRPVACWLVRSGEGQRGKWFSLIDLEPIFDLNSQGIARAFAPACDIRTRHAECISYSGKLTVWQHIVVFWISRRAQALGFTRAGASFAIRSAGSGPYLEVVLAIA